MPTPNCLHFNFDLKAKETFAFLLDQDFSVIEELPTLIRYKKDGIEVDVFHGRQSYEIGAGISGFGTRYAMSEIIRANDPEVARRYRDAVATTPEAVASALEELGYLMKSYGSRALNGDPHFFTELGQQRKLWSKDYALDVLTEQLRPKAADAFRRRDYATAAELYTRIRSRLSPAEIKKLAFAEAHLRRFSK
jgi:hypothetical protein